MANLSIDDYCRTDGLGLAGLLEAGHCTPEELMRCAIDVAQRNRGLNALTHERFEESLEVARHWRRRGPFRGIPFLLKDAVASVRFPCSVGSRLLHGTTYASNATVVDLFEEAGLIAFARTTVSEFCMGASTEAVNNAGPTLNPWDRTRSAGGSSGGAAAAVAARIVPIAHGNDGGGSIRIPAACCGVFGLKASRGRVPMGPNRGEGWGGMSCEGVLSRTVRDTAVVLDSLARWEPGAPYASPPQHGTYRDAVLPRKTGPLRIGLWRHAWDGIPVAPEVLSALDSTARLCGELGHTIVDSPLPAIDFQAFIRTVGTIFAAHTVLTVDNQLKTLGRSLRDDDLELAVRDGYDIGRSLTAVDYLEAIQHVHAIGRALHASMAGCDLVLTPTLTQLPISLGELAMDTGFWAFRQKSLRYTTFMGVVNASGCPAASVPLHWTPEGVPVATQIIGHFSREDLVLRLAAQLEEAAPWAHRRPEQGTPDRLANAVR